MENGVLMFSPANTKLEKLYKIDAVQSHLGGRKIYSLDLLAGVNCPGANICKSMAVMGDNGRLTVRDFASTQFRCYAASDETRYKEVYHRRKYNTTLLTEAHTTPKIRDLLLRSIPSDAGIVRYHAGGDFFSYSYMKAAVLVAEELGHVRFYTYTKSLHFLHRLGGENLVVGKLRNNFSITASEGGRFDRYIPLDNLRFCRTIKYRNESDGMEIDENDSHALNFGPSFCLLVHGSQPVGSDWGKAVYFHNHNKNNGE